MRDVVKKLIGLCQNGVSNAVREWWYLRRGGFV
jgi:hypothetical protein